MSKSFVRLFLCSASLMLTACGDGWEAQRTTEHFPYGGQRTAGSGVIYVKAKMLPEKELKTEPVLQPQAAPAPALDGDKIFSDAQTKGYTPPPVKETKIEPPTAEPDAKAADKEASATPALTAPQDQKDDTKVAAGAIGSAPVEKAPPPPAAAETTAKIEQAKEVVTKDAAKEVASPLAASAATNATSNATSAPAAVKSSATETAKKAAAEEATTHTPQTLTTHSLGSTAQRHPQEDEVGVTTLQPGAGVTPVDNSNEKYEVYENTVIQPTHSISMPDNEIVSPKKEVVKKTTDGQKSLQQIYDDAF